MNQRQQSERVQRRLRIIQWAAWVDLILLIALLASSFSQQRDLVHVLGPLHGINFLLLVAIVTTAALDGLWSWWFPLVVFFTGGAPGALVGEWIIKRRLKSSLIDSSEHTSSGGERADREQSDVGLPLVDERESLQGERDERGTRKEQA